MMIPDRCRGSDYCLFRLLLVMMPRPRVVEVHARSYQQRSFKHGCHDLASWSLTLAATVAINVTLHDLQMSRAARSRSPGPSLSPRTSELSGSAIFSLRPRLARVSGGNGCRSRSRSAYPWRSTRRSRRDKRSSRSSAQRSLSSSISSAPRYARWRGAHARRKRRPSTSPLGVGARLGFRGT